MGDSKHDMSARVLALRAYSVHVYTACGAALAFMAAISVVEGRPVWTFLWLGISVVVDATDGPLARRWNVKQHTPHIGGRTIDDIVDYVTFTFIPLLLVWRMEWLPDPQLLWLLPALVASMLGFANIAAKQEAHGFFLGFPSYWNIVAFYVGLLSAPFFAPWGPYISVIIVIVFTALTLLPVRFIYPNKAPKPWRRPIIAGAVIWTLILLAMLPGYPDAPLWLFLISLIYPSFYLALSFLIDRDQSRPA